MYATNFKALSGSLQHNALRDRLSFKRRIPNNRCSNAIKVAATADPQATVDAAKPPKEGEDGDLMAKPTRPPPRIMRAPPSRRTIEAKERLSSERYGNGQGGGPGGQQRPNRNNNFRNNGPGGQGGGNAEGQQRRYNNNNTGGSGGYNNNNTGNNNRSGGGPGGGRPYGAPGAGGGQQQQFNNSGGYQGNNNRNFSSSSSSSLGPAPTAPSNNTNSGGNFRGRSGGAGGGPGGGGGAGGNKRGSWGDKAAARSKAQSQRYSTIDVGSRRKARQSRKAERAEERRAAAPTREDIFEVGLEGMSVNDLAEMLAVPPVDIVKRLFMKGLAVQVNSTLDSDTVKLVGLEYGVDVLDRDEAKPEDLAKKSKDYIEEDDLEFLQTRPPVVTVMGHVDHGKTSLLDYVRKAKVAAGEAGGITQCIGAYTVDVDYMEEKKQVTFLDTPGHEAFSAMRARGTRVTDIAIIIVAADDGVRPQTLEAISHAKAAGVPIVVAINKIDKEGANPEKVKQELTEVELIPEEWGGKTPMVSISAKKGVGVDDLLETVLLVAELEELQANPDRHAVGSVLEASLDKQLGPVTTVIIQNGTLRVGDCIAAGASYGKVRSMRTTADDVTAAGPSIAVQVLGLNAVPQAGDEFEVFESETRARQAGEAVEDSRRLERLAEMAGGGSMVTLSSLASMDDDGGDEQVLQRMNIILKADMSGSCEAVKSALGALPQDTVLLRYLMAAPGDISMSDIDLAIASGGMVLGFGVTPSEAVMAAAKRAGVTLRSYSVIYDLVDDVRAAMEGKLRSVEERISIGKADVKAVFGSGNRKVAGCMVADGMLQRGAFIVVKRGKRTVYEGELTSLRRVKDDVKEVAAGTECGVSTEGFRDWEDGDKIEAFTLVQKKLKLEEAHATSLDMNSAAAAAAAAASS